MTPVSARQPTLCSASEGHAGQGYRPGFSRSAQASTRGEVRFGDPGAAPHGSGHLLGMLVSESPAVASTASSGDTCPGAFAFAHPGGRTLIYGAVRAALRRLAFFFGVTCGEGGLVSIRRSTSSIARFASAGLRSSLMQGV